MQNDYFTQTLVFLSEIKSKKTKHLLRKLNEINYIKRVSICEDIAMHKFDNVYIKRVKIGLYVISKIICN